MDNKNMITKIFPSFTKSMDAETGIVEAYVSVMGIKDLDSPPDVIQMGAFVKSIQERGPQGARKIRVLHQHWRDKVIGIPLMLVEHTRDMLPPGLLELYPEATGALFARTQFVMDVQLGRETYALYKAGAMDEWSIGFDALQFEYIKTEEESTHRLLKEIKLWEYSPVTWGANPATTTTDVKRSPADDSCRRHSADAAGGRSASGTVTTGVKGEIASTPLGSRNDNDDEDGPGGSQLETPPSPDEDRPGSHEPGTALMNLDGSQLDAINLAEPHGSALTREMAIKIKQLEIDLAMARLRRLK